MISSLQSALDKFPTISLMSQPTPIARLTRLEQACSAQARGIRIFVKRDDLGDTGGGGNKLRKLSFLLGEALATNVDTIIAMGGMQSNHARLTAAACARLGLSCELLLADMVPKHETDYRENGNVLLDRILGATLTFLPAGSDTMGIANARAKTLSASGRKAMVIPTGGSSPLGTLGYVGCAQEILDYEAANGIEFGHIVVPNGSSATHAGLTAGLQIAARRGKIVRAYSVLHDQPTTLAKTVQLVEDALALLGASDTPFDAASDVIVDGNYRGDGYGLPTTAMIEAVQRLARTEGLLLDPVYSGKAFSGLLNDIETGRFGTNTDVLFVMTGGTPGLFAYRNTFAPDTAN
ncbi:MULTISPECIES: D-cysteine desulfhydrase family protein [Pandoraea]|uniref:D-cysteine desulfhydrase family protein n=1 Tax=Pandoraea TaxID=93217 RepID=UPI001F5D4CE2|nr:MULTISPECIES: D-cysteine desulfhydrase family protein [Pandoraea]MCI3206251.1 D-cysteine desulfhydrase [Pandoraea sp. LA3]MDN4584279.1 D-cysteine desulfhydrase [Pandoraea capi]